MKTPARPSLKHWELLSAALLLVGMSGCGGGGSGDKPPANVSSRFSVPLTQPEEAARYLEKSIAGKYATKCETRDVEAKRAVVASLIEHRAMVEQYIASKPKSDTYQREKLGPITMRSLLKPTTGDDKWESSQTSWSEVLKDFSADATNPAYWYWIQTQVLNLVQLDADRADSGIDYIYTPGATARLEKALRITEACIQNADCGQVDFDADTARDFSRSTNYYVWLLDEIRNTSDRTSLLPRLEKLARWIKVDLKDRTFAKEASIQALAPDQYDVPLFAGDFAGAEAEIARLIENTWKDDRHSVRIRWMPSFELPTVFRFVAGTNAGERAYVQRKAHTINLFPDTRKTSIAHEFGHVLGFQDEYYEYFEPSECAYYTQMNSGDVMSNSETGLVLPIHWQELARQYPAPSANTVAPRVTP